MKILQKKTVSRDDAKEFILESEANFTKRLRETAREVVTEGKRVITLSGPSCSGKTTTAGLLVEEIEHSGRHAVVRSIDDFFFDNTRRVGEDGGVPDFDTVKSIDLEYLGKYIENLLSGKRVSTPVFDFRTSSRTGYVEYEPSERDIYVFEGIQAVYPEVVSMLGDNTSVFINVGDTVVLNGITYLPEEIRFLRRIIRDHRFRNASSEFTFALWESVRRNERENIFPNAKNSDFYIDSFLAYELFPLARHALPLLREIRNESPHREAAENLASRLREIDTTYYDDILIPADSMFREFIG